MKERERLALQEKLRERQQEMARTRETLAQVGRALDRAGEGARRLRRIEEDRLQEKLRERKEKRTWRGTGEGTAG